VVTTHRTSSTWQLRAGSDAMWVLEPLGVALRPVGLAARELDALATLLLEAEHAVDEPAPAPSVAATRTAWTASTVVVPPSELGLPLVYAPALPRSPWAAPHEPPAGR